jgi:hypothetical protein
MKKLMVVLAVVGLVGSAVYAATTNSFTNALGQVFVVIVDETGARVVSSTPGGTRGTATNTYVGLPGLVRVTAVADPIPSASKTGLIGEFYLDRASNAVWFSTGSTNWIKLSN